jgi:YesN/AraC family two-component response regulator
MQLSPYYNVYSAADGAEGIAKVEKVGPQVVITDLMMGDTDGFSVCRTLRGSLKSSHIPVIVLSGDSDSKVKALESGANVFIEKPFEMDYLLKQINGLLRMQKELRDYYSKKFVAEPSKVVISSIDEQLLSRAMECIERNMDNYGYDVEEFVSDMAVGRTILYRKIKDITGMSIKEFILDVRLKRAAQLLGESDLTVAEISDRTGFANPKYFSVCFKRRFDISPTDFKKQEKPA